MKVPPKRKGNFASDVQLPYPFESLNESPSEKEGKSQLVANKFVGNVQHPSMKVPPKRKGNRGLPRAAATRHETLNESPSEKEGKSHPDTA